MTSHVAVHLTGCQLGNTMWQTCVHLYTYISFFFLCIYFLEGERDFRYALQELTAMLERAREDIKAVRLQLHASEAKAQNAEQLERENRRLRDESSRQKAAAAKLEERLLKVRQSGVPAVILCNILVHS